MHLILTILLALGVTVAGAAVSDNKPRNYASQLDKSNFEFLRELVQTLEETGLKRVRVIPQMFVIAVERPDGTTATLVVDYNTLQMYETGPALNSPVGANINIQDSSDTRVKGLR